jgi:hypothetical protein
MHPLIVRHPQRDPARAEATRRKALSVDWVTCLLPLCLNRGVSAPGCPTACRSNLLPTQRTRTKL